MYAVLLYVRGYFDASVFHTFELVVIGAIVYGAVLLVMRDEFFCQMQTTFLKGLLKGILKGIDIWKK